MIRNRNLPLLAALGVIAFWTLFPSADRQPEPFSLCVVCGSRGAADAVLNLLLFVPLGMAAGRRMGWRAVVATGFLVSLFVEIAQTTIPGREPTAGDLLFNTLGALAGFLLLKSFTRPSTLFRGKLVPVALSATIAGLLILAGLLRAPSLPDSTYYGQWTPELGRSRPYPGRVLAAVAGGVDIPNKRLDSSAGLRDSLMAGSPVEVLAVAGAPTGRTTLLFNIRDEMQREVVSLAVEGDDLLASYGSRIESMRLEPSISRFPDLLAGVEPADTFRVTFNVTENSATVAVDGATRDAVRIYSPGEGWRLLIGGGGSPTWAGRLISFFWLVALTVPVGYFARSSASLAAAGVVVVWLTMAIAYFGGLQHLPLTEAVAPLLGTLLGRFVARRARFLPIDGTESGPRWESGTKPRSARRSRAASG